MHVVATAGHVDHGKSTLVQLLSGSDPDRWAEEKRRGLTIDLGFAHTTIGDGCHLALVDVPGHVRFIRNMLAGVGAVDAAMFVVAANEGWKPQSEEHLRILDLLGVHAAVAVVTKVGLASPERTADVATDVAARLGETGLAGAAVVATDSVSGEGLPALRSALAALLDRTPIAVDEGRPRLWVDRSFAARGAGTVVTGTLTGGSLAVGDEVAVGGGPGPAAAARRTVRIRGIQVHGEPQPRVAPGHRVALNLVGAHHRELVRGDALVRDRQWEPTRRIDVALQVLASLGHPVSRRGAYALYAGTGEQAVRIRILGPDAIEPGGDGLARLHLPVALPLLPGDRFVLREHGRGETVGGGEILDVAPVLPASRARPARTGTVERVVAERGWVDVDLLARITGTRRAADVGTWVVDPHVLAAARVDLRARVDAAGELGLDVAGLDPRRRALVGLLDGVGVVEGRATTTGGDWDGGGECGGVGGGVGSVAWGNRNGVGAGGQAAGDGGQGRVAGRAGGVGPAGPRSGSTYLWHPWLDALDAARWSPPDPHAQGVPSPLLRMLVRSGRVVERDGTYFSADAVAGAASIVACLLAASPAGVTVRAVRDALGSSRRHVLPLLAHLDATGVTRRRGDVRIAGPRLPAPPG